MNDNDKQKLNEDLDAKLNVAHVKPFTKFKAIEMAVCCFAVIIGLLYLYTSLIPLGVLMPLFSAAFVTLPVLRYLDSKACGVKGTPLIITTIAWSILALAVIAATVYYFVG